MSRPGLARTLWQAKLPIAMAILVAVLVALALGADERRRCRQDCLKEGHVDYRYWPEGVGGSKCECVGRDGKIVPPSAR
jgi:hypothetical protein